MKKTIISFIAAMILITCFTQVNAQNYDQLQFLEGHKLNIYFSDGQEKRASTIAEQMDNVINFYTEIVNFIPEVNLLILNPEDWGDFTGFPVYGMPHYASNGKDLIIASQNNAMWDSFIPPLEILPDHIKEQVLDTYKDEEDNLSMQAFFDLLAIHELGHAYKYQAGLNPHRKWMGELFCNVMLHTYIAEQEPENLPALTVFPQMVISGDKNQYRFTSLADFENHYGEIGSQHPQNYGWYQCRLHAASADLYDVAGVELFVNLWNTLKTNQEQLTDEMLIQKLNDNVHPQMAELIINW
jgi:hypothetical protein